MELPWQAISALLLAVTTLSPSAAEVQQWNLLEVELQSSSDEGNPWVEISAEALLTPTGSGKGVTLPLFWDGARVWKFRFAPEKTGDWTWRVRSNDPQLNGQSGAFTVTPGAGPGPLQPMPGYPHHFSRKGGGPIWFLADTAWALFTDNLEEKHDRAAATAYLQARARQGFGAIHSMLLSEAGWGNQGGLPFLDIAQQKINPGYWQEVDWRIRQANETGLICGLVLAWGDKQRKEPFAWRKFPSLEARKRYARYIAARYSAFDVYFIVAGEWHAEIRTRPQDEESLRREFIQIGDVVRAADPHGRMMAIHPMTSHGSVREFNSAAWMSFGDYQQNYEELHGRILLSRKFEKPVVNSEYGYYLRDQNGDGTPDKENSTALGPIRHATWDIVMAGGYVVTGFGSTYFGGNRHPGPFHLEAPVNRDWELQIGWIRELFESLEWWKLAPHDDLISDRVMPGKETVVLGRIAPPVAAQWCLAEPGRQYLVYHRGIDKPVVLKLSMAGKELRTRLFNPRTGQFTPALSEIKGDKLEWSPPLGGEDWVLMVQSPVSP